MRIRWRNLELPNRVTVNQESYTSSYGEFTIEPFERGYGHTIGNSLRRVLLSSLEGTAVTSIKIEGVSHEFTSIPGVMEPRPSLMASRTASPRSNRTGRYIRPRE